MVGDGEVKLMTQGGGRSFIISIIFVVLVFVTDFYKRRDRLEEKSET